MHQALTTPPLARDAVKKRRQGRRRKILFGSAGAVLLLIVALIVAGKREKPIPVTTEKAVRRTILQTVSATGKVQPETEVKISPEVAGEIIELPVEDGMQVKKNDLLVKIKPDSYRAQLEQQEAAISAAKATNLQQKATMLKTEHDFRRSKDLFEKKLISEQEYNAAEAANDVAKNTYRQFSARDRTGPGELEPGARSTFENDDLFADGRNDYRFKQQTGRTPRRDESICRNRSDASGRSYPYASRRRRKRE